MKVAKEYETQKEKREKSTVNVEGTRRRREERRCCLASQALQLGSRF